MPAVPTDTPVQSGATPGPQIPYPPYPYFMPPEEDEINLIDLLRVVRKRWKIIFLITFLGTAAAVTYALLATPIYRARAVIAPPAQQQAGGLSSAIGAFGGLGAELAGSIGLSLGGTDADRLEALLNSHRVMERVATKHDLLLALFEDDWDAEHKRWIKTDPEDIPTIWDAEKKLESIYSAKKDKKTDFLTVTFDWEDTDYALKIVRGFLEQLIFIIQEDELRKIDLNRRFIDEQLKHATDPIVIAKLQSLLSNQVEKAMMAQNAEQFAYEIIDPPAVSSRKVKPKRRIIAIAGLVVFGFLGILFAFVREHFERLAAGEKDR